jgi:hypothetical protein
MDTASIAQAKSIMGKNFIGADELCKIISFFPIANPYSIRRKIPPIPYKSDMLKEIKKDYLLILGVPKDKAGNWLTINRLREIYGCDPKHSEPCLYNQDWYLKEKFASQTRLAFKWHLIRKTVAKQTRGKDPSQIQKHLNKAEHFPSALLTVFTFFAYYFHTGGDILWKHDFLWCSDRDHNGDIIYTGRYLDPAGVNKNGFNIHRYLSIRRCYGLAPVLYP